VAEMCEYCAGLMHKQGRLTDALAMAEQVGFCGPVCVLSWILIRVRGEIMGSFMIRLD
jgi:hypothetical protein